MDCRSNLAPLASLLHHVVWMPQTEIGETLIFPVNWEIQHAYGDCAEG